MNTYDCGLCGIQFTDTTGAGFMPLFGNCCADCIALTGATPEEAK